MPVIKLVIFLNSIYVWHDNEVIISSYYENMLELKDRYEFDNITVWKDTREELKIIVEDERENERKEDEIKKELNERGIYEI